MNRAVIITAVALALIASPLAAAEPPADEAMSRNFLSLTHEQRYWWIHGAVTTLSHAAAMRNPKQGDCIAQWFLRDRTAKQALIEDTMRKFPKEGPTTMVITLVVHACGELAPAR